MVAFSAFSASFAAAFSAFLSPPPTIENGCSRPQQARIARRASVHARVAWREGDGWIGALGNGTFGRREGRSHVGDGNGSVGDGGDDGGGGSGSSSGGGGGGGA